MPSLMISEYANFHGIDKLVLNMSGQSGNLINLVPLTQIKYILNPTLANLSHLPLISKQALINFLHD
jgi:hypothetical protein